jgi:uncharacterized membrane protein
MEKRERRSKIIILLFFIPIFIWLILQFISPIVIPQGTITDLSGSTLISENKKPIDQLGFPWGNIYQCGDIFCHQKAERSFFINDNQMPFCARCTAIWLGITIGLGFLIFFKIPLDKKFLYLILIGVIPIGIDGVGQFFQLWESNNIIRLITGLLIGIICGIAIGLIIEELREIIKLKKSKYNQEIKDY